jgi:hypothetical protein
MWLWLIPITENRIESLGSGRDSGFSFTSTGWDEGNISRAMISEGRMAAALIPAAEAKERLKN